MHQEDKNKVEKQLNRTSGIFRAEPVIIQEHDNHQLEDVCGQPVLSPMEKESSTHVEQQEKEELKTSGGIVSHSVSMIKSEHSKTSFSNIASGSFDALSGSRIVKEESTLKNEEAGVAQPNPGEKVGNELQEESSTLIFTSDMTSQEHFDDEKKTNGKNNSSNNEAVVEGGSSSANDPALKKLLHVSDAKVDSSSPLETAYVPSSQETINPRTLPINTIQVENREQLPESGMNKKTSSSPAFAQPELRQTVSASIIPTAQLKPTEELSSSAKLTSSKTQGNNDSNQPLVQPAKRGFSISGMWNNVDLGLVKERSTVWDRREKSEPLVRTRPRRINPNAWQNYSDPNSATESGRNTKRDSLHKARSSGDLLFDGDQEEDVGGVDAEVAQVVTNSVVSWEERRNGRKSADVFSSQNSAKEPKSEFTANEEDFVIIRKSDLAGLSHGSSNNAVLNDDDQIEEVFEEICVAQSTYTTTGAANTIPPLPTQPATEPPRQSREQSRLSSASPGTVLQPCSTDSSRPPICPKTPEITRIIFTDPSPTPLSPQSKSSPSPKPKPARSITRPREPAADIAPSFYNEPLTPQPPIVARTPEAPRAQSAQQMTTAPPSQDYATSSHSDHLPPSSQFQEQSIQELAAPSLPLTPTLSVTSMISMTPGSSMNDLSTCGGGSGDTTPTKSGRSRRKKSSKIAEDIARRAEEFATMEKDKKRKEELRKKAQERMEAERVKNMPQIQKTIEKKQPKTEDKVPIEHLDGNAEVPEEIPTERLKQVEADLKNQKAFEEKRLRQIEEDRQRQLIEEERIRKVEQDRMEQMKRGEDFDPREVFEHVGRKLEEKRVREARRRRKLAGECSSANSSVQSLNNIGDNKNIANYSTTTTTNDKVTVNATATNPAVLIDRVEAQCEIPIPPQRDIESESKVLQKIAKAGNFPSQQERWKVKMAEDERRRLATEKEAITRLEEEKRRREEKTKIAENSSSSNPSGPNNNSCVAEQQEALKGCGSEYRPGSTVEEGDVVMAQAPGGRRIKRQISREEENKLKEWEMLKRQEAEMEEQMIRQMEKELLLQKKATSAAAQKDDTPPPLPPPPPALLLPVPPPPGLPVISESPPLPPPPPADVLIISSSTNLPNPRKVSQSPPPPPQRHSVRSVTPSKTKTVTAQSNTSLEAEKLKTWEIQKRKEEEEQEKLVRDLERDLQREKSHKTTMPEPTKQTVIEPPNLKILNVSHSSSKDSEWKPDNFLVQPVPGSQDNNQAGPHKKIARDLGNKNCEEIMKKQQREWEELKRRQEEEEMQMILQMERDLIKERQVQQAREKERLDVLEVMRIKEEEEAARRQQMKIQAEETKAMNERITAMSITEEEEEATEAAEEINRLREKEEAEKKRLLEIEVEKRELEEELIREKQHLEELQKLETTANTNLTASHPQTVELRGQSEQVGSGRRSAEHHHSPSPGVKRKGAPSPSFEAVEKERSIELQKILELKNLEQQKLRELAEIRSSSATGQPSDLGTLLISSAPHTKALPPLPIQSKVLRKVRSQGLSERTSSESEEDMFCGGLSEACEETSIGIDLPANDQSSGNVTPIPTTGELEDISTEELPSQESFLTPPRTPLKSLLKKPSIEEDFPPPSLSDVEEPDSRSSPPKKVHFSEINQVKLMSQESIASTVTSEADTATAAAAAAIVTATQQS